MIPWLTLQESLAGLTRGNVDSHIGRTSLLIPKAVRVLLVDDSMVITDRLSKALHRIDGVQIAGVSRAAQQALSDIDRLHPDIVVLDIALRESNGWDVLKSLKTASKNIRVFVFSNDSVEATRARFVAAGADRFFDKSKEFLALHQALKELAAPTCIIKFPGPC